MAKKIFDTYHAPDDEIAGIKLALDEAEIPWYETTKGRWWIGSAALWVNDPADAVPARDVIDHFQSRWVIERRAEARQDNQGIRWARVPVFLLVTGVLLYLMTFWYWL